jgi:hypothetical protein
MLIQDKPKPEMAQLSFGITPEWQKLFVAGADEIHFRSPSTRRLLDFPDSTERRRRMCHTGIIESDVIDRVARTF